MIKFLFTITLSLFLSACLISPGTNTGNPGEDASSPNHGTATYAPYLATYICGKVKSCNSQADTQTCYHQIYTLQGYTSELGTPAADFDTLQDLYNAEIQKLVTPSQTYAQYCLNAIAKLDCADSLMQSAYSNSSPSDYSATNLLFQAAPSCRSIY